MTLFALPPAVTTAPAVLLLRGVLLQARGVSLIWCADGRTLVEVRTRSGAGWLELDGAGQAWVSEHVVNGFESVEGEAT